MKVKVAGSNQELDVEGSFSVGDILIFTSTMAVIKVDEGEDNSEAVLVANTLNGIRTSELFVKLAAKFEGVGETDEDSG